MNDIKRLVPNLRFPAFTEDGEWREQEFSSLFAFLPNNTLSRADLQEGKGDVYNVHYGDVLIKLNSYTDIQQGKLPAIKTVNDIDKYLKVRLQDGDIVIADTAEDEAVGKCTEIVNVHDTIVVSGLHTIPCRPQIKFAQAYLGYYINSNAFHSKLLPIMQGVKVTSISKTALQNIDLVYPESLEEQKKIAECLSSIDAYIFSINEKVEQLKAHKKSLLQKLFPQGGKTIPEYRFPEFNTEWKKVTLGDIFVERREHSTITDDLPQLSFTIEEGVIYPNNKKTNKRDFLINDKDNKKYLVTYIDDIIYNPANVIYGAIHKNSLCNGVVSPIYKIFSTSQDASFMEYIVRMPEFIQKMSTYMEGTVLKLRTLKPESFLKMEVFIAPSLAEQRKIAECLSSIDKTIEYYTKKSIILEQHKKGLMQQLFPKLKEL